MAEENSRSEERRLKEISAMLARVRVLPRGRIYMGLREVGIKLLSALKDEQEKVRQLSAKVEEDHPKVLFADSVSAASNSILIGELAKLIKFLQPGRGRGLGVGVVSPRSSKRKGDAA